MEATIKQKYTIPIIEKIILDNQFSLALESEPPFGPGETIVKTPDYFNNNPFNSNLG